MSDAKRFHLGWFFEGASPHSWNRPFTGAIGRDWMSAALPVDLARAAERACLDYLLIEDSSYVADAWEGSMRIYLEKAIATPRQDPAVVANLMLQATTHLGVVPTLATFAYPPYLLARLLGSLDQVSGGRVGWNMVTGSSTRAAQNFGMDDLPPHDERYAIADEYMEVVYGLWDSWEPDAIGEDAARGVFADPDKVHVVNHEGKYFRVRGPLNSGPLPQGRPAIAQAGGSDRGRQFAATHANTIVTHVPGVEKMKTYRDDVRTRMVAAGRNPDDCKVMFLINPIIGSSARDAQERLEQRRAANLAHADQSLAHMSKVTNIDFSVIGLDTVIEDQRFETNGHQSSLEQFLAQNRGRTLREAAAATLGRAGSVDLVGTPEAVASQMKDVMDEVGGDGFLFNQAELSRRSVAEILDGLVPELQARGLVRTSYVHRQLRDNLLEF